MFGNDLSPPFLFWGPNIPGGVNQGAGNVGMLSGGGSVSLSPGMAPGDSSRTWSRTWNRSIPKSSQVAWEVFREMFLQSVRKRSV